MVEASHGLHSHEVLCFAKGYAIQTVLLKAQINDFCCSHV